MTELREVVELVARDNLSAGVGAAQESIDKFNAALDRQDATIRRTAPTAESLVRRLDAVTKAEAALAAASAKAAREREVLDAGLRDGAVAADAHARAVAAQAAAVAQAEANLARARGAASTTANAVGGLATNTKEAAWQMRSLALQTPDVVQGLLGGQSAFQVLLQQGGQVVQVMGGVGAALRGVGSLLMNAIASPGGAAVIATVALAGLGYAAESAERRIIGLQNSLRATRSDYAALAETVNQTAKTLGATTNIGTGEARDAGRIIAASPAFAGGQAELADAIRLAKDLAETMGTELPEAAQRLAGAMRDPGAAAQRLADEGLRSMSQALAYSIKLQAEAGDRAGAYARVVDSMREAVGGASEPHTKLQTALNGLSQAFTRTGQDGRSLAEAIGSVVVDAASLAVRAITDVINAIERLRQAGVTVQQEVAARRGATSPSIAAQNPDTVGMPVLLGPEIPGRTERATGLFQVLPSTGREMGYRVEALDQNILAGLTYLDRMRTATGSIDGGLARYGGYGNDVTAAQGYIGRVRGARLTDLPADIASQIEYWGQILGMSPEMIELGQRLAVVESGGRHYAPRGATVTGAVPRGEVVDGLGTYVPAPGGALATALQGRRADRQTEDQAFSIYRSSDALSTRIAMNTAQQTAVQQGIDLATRQGNTERVGQLTEALQKLKGAATELVSEQEKIARTAEDSAAALTVEDGATRELAAIRQRFVETARRTGTVVDEAAVARAQAVRLQELSVALYDNVDAMNRKTDAERRVLPLLEQGGRAAEYAANRERAVEEVRKSTLPNTIARKVAEEALTAAYNRNTDAQIDRQAAMDVAKFQQQIEYQQTELDLLTATSEERARELAILQERQKLGLKVGEQATEQQQRALDAAAAAATLGDKLRRAQSIVNSVADSIVQAFDDVGKAIVNAYVLGERSALNWGRIGMATAASVANALLKSLVIQPVTDSLRPTIAGVLGVGSGGASGGGIMDLLGLSSLLPKEGIMSALGLDGLFGASQTMTQSLSTGATTIAGGSLGSILGAAGLGFGAGSLLNSLLGRQGAQATNGMIGSGVGSLAGMGVGMALDLAFPGLGTVVSLLGGLLGGGVGGLFGPGQSVQGYGYALRGNDAGQLVMTDQFYNDSGKAAFEEAAQGIAALNQWMSQYGVKIGGAIGVGGNRFGADYSHAAAGSFTEGVSKLYYSATDPELDNALAMRGRQFASTDELQKLVEGFTATKQAITALTAEPIPAFTAQMKAITDSFDAALAKAREYGLAEGELTAARQKAVSELEAQRTETLRQSDVSLTVRRLAAAGNSQEAELARQAESARQELKAFGEELDRWAISAADKAARLVELEQVQAAERADIIRRYGEEAANALRDAGGNISSYLDALATSADGGASPTDRLAAAQSQFARDRTLAMGGDRDALSRITSTADALLTAGRDMYASTEGFQAIRQDVIDSLSNLPVVKSYDAMQTDALEAIQDAIENGTLNTSILGGNTVTIAGGTLVLAGVEARLDTLNTTVGWVVDTIAAVSTMDRTVLGWIVDTLSAVSVQERTVLGWIVDAINATSVLDRTATGYVVDTLAAVSTTSAGYQHQHSLYLSGIGDALGSANRIAADASAATTESFAAMNRILVDGAGATTRATVDVNASLGTVDASINAAATSIRSADTNTTASLTALNRIVADGMGATGLRIDAGNRIAADAAQAETASIAALNRIAVDASVAEVTALAALTVQLGALARQQGEADATTNRLLTDLLRAIDALAARIETLERAVRQTGADEAAVTRDGLNAVRQSVDDMRGSLSRLVARL